MALAILAALVAGAAGPAVAVAQSLVITQPVGGCTWGFPCVTQPVIELRDAGGVRVAGATTPVTIVKTSVGGLLSGTLTVSAVDGVATFTDVTVPQGSPISFRFDAAGYTSATQSNLTTQAPALSLVTAPAGITYGYTFVTQPTVEVRDPNRGTRITAMAGTVSAQTSYGNGGLQGTTTVNLVNGLATFTDLAFTAALAGNERLSFMYGPDATQVSMTTSSRLDLVAVNPTLAITQQAGQVTYGVPFGVQPLLEIRDPNRASAVISSFNGKVTVQTGGSGGLQGSTTVAASSGVAQFTDLMLTSAIAGGERLYYAAPTAGVAGGATATGAPLSPSMPSIVVTQEPAGFAAGYAFLTQPVVRVADPNQANAAITSFNGPVTVQTVDAGTLSGTTTVNAVNGVATFSDAGLSATTTRLMFSATLPNTPSATNVITNFYTAGTPSLAVTQQPAGAVSGSAFATQPAVQARTTDGLLLTSASPAVTAAVASGSGALSGTTAPSMPSGALTYTDLAISGTGNHQLRFTAPGFSSTTSGFFNVAAPLTLAVTPTAPSASDIQGATATRSQGITVTLSGSNNASTAWTAAVQGSAPWLTLTGATGTGSGAFTLVRNPTGLAVGTYTATVLVSAGGFAETVTDIYTITAPLALTVHTTSTSASAIAGSTTALPQSGTVTLSGTGAGSTAWTATVQGSAPWLTVTSGNGTGSGTLSFSRNPTGLAQGTYTATVRVSAGGLTLDVTDVLTITAPLALSATPTTPTASAITGTAAPVTQSVAVTLAGTGAAGTAWTAAVQGSAPWITLTAGSGTGSGTLQYTRSAAALTPGTYTAVVRVTAGGLTQEVTDQFTVTAALALAVNPSAPTSTAIAGSSAPVTQDVAVTLSGTGAGSTAWSAAVVGTPAPWITLTNAGGTGSGTLQYSRDASTLAVGSYSATIRVTAGGLTQDVTDAFTVTAPMALSVAPSTTSGSAITGNATPVSLTAAVTLNGTGAAGQAWTAAVQGGPSAAPWLTFTTASGTGSGTVAFSRSAATLAPGTYAATIVVTAGALTQTISDQFTVTAALGLALSPSSTSATDVQGSTTAKPQTVAVTLSGTGAAGTSWSAAVQGSAPWITLTTAAGTGSGTLAFTRRPDGLTAGTYSATVRVTAGGLTQDVTDVFTIASALALAATPTTTSASAVTGSSATSSQNVAVALTGTGAAGTAWTASVQGTAAWLTLTTSAGTGSGTLRFARNPSGLVTGTYTATVRITAGALTQDVTDTYTITPALALAVAPSATGATVPTDAAPTTQDVAVTLSGTGAGAQAWSAAVVGTAPWLSITSGTGVGSGTLTFARSTAGLAAGTYTATVRVTAGALTQDVVDVFTVNALPVAFTLAVNPTATAAAGTAGATAAVTGTATVTLSGDGASTTAWAATIQGGNAAAPWLTLTTATGTGSGTLAWSRSAGWLADGTYRATLVVTGGGQTATVSDVFTVSTPFTLALTPTGGACTMIAGKSAARSGSASLALGGTGSGAVAWTASSSVPWLTLERTSGVGSASLAWTRSAATLAPGSHTGSIEVTANGRQATVTETCTVTDPLALAIVPPTTSATEIAGMTTPIGGMAQVRVTGTGATTAEWRAATTAPWITVTGSQGTGTGMLTWTRSAAALSPGTYVGRMTVTAAELTAAVVDTFVVTEPLTFAITPPQTHAAVLAGVTTPIAGDAQVVMRGTGATVTTWQARTGAPWVTLTTPRGTGTGALTWTRSAAGLAPGAHVATISVWVGALQATLTDTLTVVELVRLRLAGEPSRTTAAVEGADRVRDSVRVELTGDSASTATWTAAVRDSSGSTGGRPSVVVVTPRGVGSGWLVFTRSAEDLDPGVVTATLAVTCARCASDAGVALIVDTLRVTPITPDLAAQHRLAGGVLNARQEAKLDRLGNHNGAFDVGDVHALMVRTRQRASTSAGASPMVP